MQENKPSLFLYLLKVVFAAALVLYLAPMAMVLLYYLVGGFFYHSWDGNFRQRVEQLNANNFSQIALMDITPPPLDPDHVSIGPQGPYFLFVKINRGENPGAQDPRYPTDRDQVEFIVRKGCGVIKPLTAEKSLFDALTLTHEYTFSADEHGQVLAVFYPSVFNRPIFTKSMGRDIVITAQVVNNPKITNELTYEWTPVSLVPEDFKRAVEAFVDWHNKTRLVDRTETGTEVPSSVDGDSAQFDQALGITPPPSLPIVSTTVQGGKAQCNGQDVPNEEYSYDYFFSRTGREPWGYTGGNVVFISREFTGSVDFWAYDPATGLMKEKVRYPSPSGLGAQEDLSEYQDINGNYFHYDELFLDYYGRTNTYRSELRLAVALAQ